MPPSRTRWPLQVNWSLPNRTRKTTVKGAPSSDIGSGRRRVLHQCARRRAIIEALAAAGALLRDDLVEVARLQQFRADRRFRAHLAAQPARIADRVVDQDFHQEALDPFSASWPGLTRPSMRGGSDVTASADARIKSGHDEYREAFVMGALRVAASGRNRRAGATGSRAPPRRGAAPPASCSRNRADTCLP